MSLQVNLLAIGPAEITSPPLLGCFQYRHSSTSTESWIASSLSTSLPPGQELANFLPSRHLNFGMIEMPTSQSFWPGMRPGPGEKIGDPDQELSEAIPYIHQELPPGVSCTIGELLKIYVGEGPQVCFQGHPEQPISNLHVKSSCRSGFQGSS